MHDQVCACPTLPRCTHDTPAEIQAGQQLLARVRRGGGGDGRPKWPRGQDSERKAAHLRSATQLRVWLKRAGLGTLLQRDSGGHKRLGFQRSEGAQVRCGRRCYSGDCSQLQDLRPFLVLEVHILLLLYAQPPMSGEGRDDGWAEVAVAVELQGFGDQDVVGMVGVK